MKFFAVALTTIISNLAMVEGACPHLNKGDESAMNVPSPFHLNTAEVQEEEDNPAVDPRYPPLNDAVCFNQNYSPPKLDLDSMAGLYKDFVKIFEWGFKNKMGSPLESVSEGNNNVSNNRFPGMYLRMCFHDNTVVPGVRDFQDYVKGNVDVLDGKWKGPGKYMATSGADASLLTCEAERLHPNNNYDRTASRVLYSMQVEDVIEGGKSLKEKYDISYADLLHNGCIAANIYLTREPEKSVLKLNPMAFGRHDACFVDCENKKKELCGLPGILPGLALNATETNSWFTSRGMSECLWMSTMWSHTTMDNMAMTCPLQNTPCKPGTPEMDEFYKVYTDEPYFALGDELDYFKFFTRRGRHFPNNKFIEDPEDGSCDWFVKGRREPWPLTKIDCTLGLDNVVRSGEKVLAGAIRNFNKAGFRTKEIFLCAMNIFGGRGGREGRICNRIIKESCRAPADTKFGGVFNVKVPYNLVEGQPCEMSSLLGNNGIYACSKANDGKVDSRFAHTDNEPFPYWRSTFAQKSKVNKVVIFNRPDCCQERLTGARISLLGADGSVVWTSSPLDNSRKQTLYVPPTIANSVQLQLPKHGILNFAEIQVFGIKA